MWAAQPAGDFHTWGSGTRHRAPSQGSDWRGMFPCLGASRGSLGEAARDRKGSFVPESARSRSFLWKRSEVVKDTGQPLWERQICS